MKRHFFALGVFVGLLIALVILTLALAIAGVEAAAPDSWSARLIRGGDVAHWSVVTPGGQANYSGRIVGATLWLWQGHDAMPNATLEVIHFPGGAPNCLDEDFRLPEFCLADGPVFGVVGAVISDDPNKLWRGMTRLMWLPLLKR